MGNLNPETLAQSLRASQQNRKEEAAVDTVCKNLWRQACAYRNSKFKICLRELTSLLAKNIETPGSFLERLQDKKFAYVTNGRMAKLAKDTELCSRHPKHFLIAWGRLLDVDATAEAMKRREEKERMDQRKKAPPASQTPPPSAPVSKSMPILVTDDATAAGSKPPAAATTTPVTAAGTAAADKVFKKNPYAILFKNTLRIGKDQVPGRDKATPPPPPTFGIVNGTSAQCTSTEQPQEEAPSNPSPPIARSQSSNASSSSSSPNVVQATSAIPRPPKILKISVCLESRCELEISPAWATTKYKIYVLQQHPQQQQQQQQQFILFIPHAFTSSDGLFKDDEKEEGEIYTLTSKEIVGEAVASVTIESGDKVLVHNCFHVKEFEDFVTSTLRRGSRLTSTLLSRRDFFHFSDRYDSVFGPRHLLGDKEYLRLVNGSNLLEDATTDPVFQILLGKDLNSSGDKFEFQKFLKMKFEMEPTLSLNYLVIVFNRVVIFLPSSESPTSSKDDPLRVEDVLRASWVFGEYRILGAREYPSSLLVGSSDQHAGNQMILKILLPPQVRIFSV